MYPDNAGSWRLTVTERGAEVEPAAEAAEVTMDVRELGALFLGAFSVVDLLSAGRAGEEREGAAALLDAMLHTPRAPWCPEIF
jgi:predicted acetyltransferase